MRVIRAAGLPVSRWPNGAGRKADLALGDGWLCGFAWLDADAPFSDLGGFDRTITLVDGPGFTLELAGQPDLVVYRPFHPSRFDGGVATQCRTRGPSRVLNVMTARDRFRHTITVAAGPVQLDRAAGLAVSLCVLLRGEATATDSDGSFTLAALDAIAVEGLTELAGDAAALFASITVAPV